MESKHAGDWHSGILTWGIMWLQLAVHQFGACASWILGLNMCKALSIYVATIVAPEVNLLTFKNVENRGTKSNEFASGTAVYLPTAR